MTKARHALGRLQLVRLEDRLTPSWAGVPPTLITPPTAFTGVTLNSLGDASSTATISNNEVDYFRFTAQSTGAHTFQATTPSSNVDPVVGLFSATGQRLGYNDDISTSNTDSRFTLSLTAGQTYFLGVTNYTNSSLGSYSLLIDGPAQVAADDTFENNDTLALASNLGTLSAVRTINNLVMADGNDWYRFQTNAAGTSTSSVSISFQHSQGDLDLELYNSAGTRLLVSNGVTNSEQVSLNGLAAGTYYARVLGYQGANNPNYTLTITPPVTTPPPTGGFQITVAFGGGLTTSQRAAFSTAAARWAQIITGDLPNATYQGRVIDDVEISASGAAIDGQGGILGQAGPDALRAGSSLPYHGTMQFDTADLAALERNGQLVEVILHEMGHVLGIGTIWSRLGLLSGAGGSNPIFTGTRATAQFNQIFGRTAAGVPVENSGGAGTRDSHWRESTFGAELMTGFINSGVANPISRVTAASLADMGYTVNLNAADAYAPPAGGAGQVVANPGGGAASLVAFTSSKDSPKILNSSSEKVDGLIRTNNELMQSLGGQNISGLLKALGRGRGLVRASIDDYLAG